MSDLDGIAKMLPLTELYRDLAQPAARELGDALGSAAEVARFVLAPLDYLAAQQGRMKRYFERLAQKVSEAQRIDTHPQVAGPAFAGLQYVDEHSLNAELFLNLLARSID